MTTASRPIDEIVAQMTLAEKVGQMTQVSNDAITPAEVAEGGIGSVLSGGNGNPSPNTPEAWVDMVGSFADAAAGTRLGIPLLYGVDAVHGHSNVRGATVFPHNIGLGAVGDADLVVRIGRATATEMAATGVRWTFAPTLAVPQDIRWGRTYEGYGRDPQLVSEMGGALVTGLQDPGGEGGGVLACAKHYLGDGATTWGTVVRRKWASWWDGWGDNWQIDQGDVQISESDLRAIHLAPYVSALAAGVMTVMASYNSWHGVKVHGHRGLITGVLKEELGFPGFVVSDWMGVDQVAPDYDDAVVAAINAGIDMVMVPLDYRRFIAALTRAATAGRIPISRIDDAVRRILLAKAALGPAGPERSQPPLRVVGSAEHRSLAGEAVRRSAVLLKNERAVPLAAARGSVAVAGRAGDDVGLQCGGWTVGWQGGPGAVTPGTTLVDGLRAAGEWHIDYDPAGHFTHLDHIDVGVVCIAEPPYAEGPGDSAAPTASADDRACFARVRERADTVILVVYSGRPLAIPDLVARADAVIAAWLPGTEGAALAGLLTGAVPFTGRTPQPWPRSLDDLGNPEASPLFPAGYGLDGVRSKTLASPPGPGAEVGS